MKILPSFTKINFFLVLNTKEDILKNVSNQTVDGPQWFPLYFNLWSINCLITDILQNIFFCVQQKKETHTGLKQLEGE